MTTTLDPPPRAGRRRSGRLLIVTLLVLGLAGIAGGGAALARELTRQPTSAELAAALQSEIATRWERLTAGQVFPATVNYPDAGGVTVAARRVGIAPAASCQTALEPAAYRRLRAFGCATMLRATYVDASGSLVTTVGVAVLRSPHAAQQASDALVPLAADAGLHALPFSGTITAQFGDTSRAVDSGQAAGPYFILYTAGYADGVPGGPAAGVQDELVALGSGVASGIASSLTGHGRPCSMKDIQC